MTLKVIGLYSLIVMILFAGHGIADDRHKGKDRVLGFITILPIIIYIGLSLFMLII